jgi:hypothetical protein
MVPSAGQTYIKNNIAYYFLKVSPPSGLVDSSDSVIRFLFLFQMEKKRQKDRAVSLLKESL